MLVDVLILVFIAVLVYLVVKLRAVRGYSEAIRPEDNYQKWLAKERAKAEKEPAAKP